MQMKLLRIIYINSDVTDQLLIRRSAFVEHRDKMGYSGAVHQLFMDFKREVRVICDILVEYDIPMKLVRLINIRLYKAYMITNDVSDAYE
jgi:hypothetical protein